MKQDAYARELVKARADVHVVKKELEALNCRLKIFMRQHFVTVGGKLAWHLTSLTTAERRLREDELRHLQRQRDLLLAQWNTVLKTFSRVKSEAATHSRQLGRREHSQEEENDSNS